MKINFFNDSITFIVCWANIVKILSIKFQRLKDPIFNYEEVEDTDDKLKEWISYLSESLFISVLIKIIIQ